MKSVYIHIPFCNNICSYCDFAKIYNHEEIVNNYLNELEKEIITTYKKEEIETIYIGGGTPSVLNIKQLNKLFKIIKIFNTNNLKEFTIECNFDSTTKEKLNLFKKNGINRLSFGLESINKEELNYLNRTLNIKRVEELIKHSKRVGIENINLDIIYALKNQTTKSLKNTLDFILSLDIPHISTYSLIIEEHTILGINDTRPIDEDKDYEFYKYICNYLEEKGFKHYEISNFSKIGYESLHNTNYWSNKEYYGFGLGASSYINNTRYTNTRSITNYIKGKYILEKEVLKEKDIREYEIMLAFRKQTGINKQKFKNKFHKSLKECYNYKELIENKFIIEDNNNVYIPEKYWYISNEIIVKFLQGEIDE